MGLRAVGQKDDRNVLGMVSCLSDKTTRAQTFVIRMRRQNRERFAAGQFAPTLNRQALDQMKVVLRVQGPAPMQSSPARTARAASLIAMSGTGCLR